MLLVPCLAKITLLSCHTLKRALSPAGKGHRRGRCHPCAHRASHFLTSLGFNPTRLGCLWRYPWNPQLTTPWLWNFTGLSGPGGTGADGKSSAAGGQGGAAQGALDSPHGSEITPGKTTSTKAVTPPDSAVLLSLFSMGCSPPFYFSCCFSKDVFHLLHTLCSTIFLDHQVFGESFPQDLCFPPEPC